jgi:hypothetical protein
MKKHHTSGGLFSLWFFQRLFFDLWMVFCFSMTLETRKMHVRRTRLAYVLAVGPVQCSWNYRINHLHILLLFLLWRRPLSDRFSDSNFYLSKPFLCIPWGDLPRGPRLVHLALVCSRLKEVFRGADGAPTSLRPEASHNTT